MVPSDRTLPFPQGYPRDGSPPVISVHILLEDTDPLLIELRKRITVWAEEAIQETGAGCVFQVHVWK